jgi:hypothetical protein
MALGTGIVFAISIATACSAQSRSNLSAAEIVNRNVAARGGLQAWRAVNTMSWTGQMGAGGNQQASQTVPVLNRKSATLLTDPRPKDEIQLPFTLEMARPRKVRLEILFRGQNAVQVFNGTAGWKLRPYLNRLEVEPFTSEELKEASMQAELDGPLVDYAAKGTRIELVGMEKVEDRDTYKLKLTMSDGRATHVWIDAQTFLEAKIEGQPRQLDGIERPVEIYYRDYRPVNGLQIPFVLETKVLPLAKAAATGVKDNLAHVERITIEKVQVNPKLAESLFSKPQLETASTAH